MSDIDSAYREFERMVFGGVPSPEPPDDRKTYDDLQRYPRRDVQQYRGRGTLLATMIMDPKTHKIRYIHHRPRPASRAGR